MLSSYVSSQKTFQVHPWDSNPVLRLRCKLHSSFFIMVAKFSIRYSITGFIYSESFIGTVQRCIFSCLPEQSITSKQPVDYYNGSVVNITIFICLYFLFLLPRGLEFFLFLYFSLSVLFSQHQNLFSISHLWFYFICYLPNWHLSSP